MIKAASERVHRRAEGRPPGRWSAFAAAAVLVGLCAGGCGRRGAPGPLPVGAAAKDAAVPVARGPSWQETDDPSRDGWDTEVFSARAEKQLKVLLHALEGPGVAGAGPLAGLLAEGFSSEPLAPAALRSVFESGALRVRRNEGAGARGDPPLLGASGLAQALRDVAAQLPPDRVLVETDCPYLAPVPYRGKRNEPAYVAATAAALARLRGEPPDELAHRTTANARKALRLPGGSP